MCRFTSGIYRGTCGDGHVVFIQERRTHTEHHDHRVEASMERDIGATAVDIHSVGHGVDAEREDAIDTMLPKRKKEV